MYEILNNLIKILYKNLMYQLYNIQASSVSEWQGRWHEHKRRQRDLKTDMETTNLETLK